MTPLLQFSLTFTTLVVLAVILYLRLRHYEAYLRDLEGIKTLNQRLKALVDGLQSLGTKRVELQLQEIQEVLQEIRNGIAQWPGRESEGSPSRSSPNLLDICERKLYAMGYEEVRVLSDLSGVNPLEPVRVVVEARKDGVACKGHLVLHGSAVTEMDLQRGYTSFP